MLESNDYGHQQLKSTHLIKILASVRKEVWFDNSKTFQLVNSTTSKSFSKREGRVFVQILEVFITENVKCAN